MFIFPDFKKSASREMKPILRAWLVFVVSTFLLVDVSCQTFTPVFYSVSLDFSSFTPKSRIFDGQANIYFNVSQDTFGLQDIILDSELIHVRNISVVDTDSETFITVVRAGPVNKKYHVTVKLDDKTTRLRVKIGYQGQVGRAGDTGVYMTDQENVIATNSYPLGVRKIFPCVNDPTVRTPFQFNVKLVNDKWGIHRMTSQIQSPFLPAHAVGFIMTYRYRKVDDISTDRFHVWVPDNDQSLYDAVNDNPILLNAFKEGSYFDDFFRPAGLDKIHVVMVPGLGQLSVVNHRLISIRPDFMMWRREGETSAMAKGSAVAVLNALSKHFFRCVVSPKNWQDFWLADSTALFLQYALLNNTIFHDVHFPELFTTDLQRPAMRGSSIQVNPKQVDPSILITPDVYPPAYQGAAILKMVESLSWQKNITGDLYNYYRSFVYENVETDEFLNFMSNQSVFKELNTYGKGLSTVLDKWIHETGYPYLSNLSVSTDGFALAQRKFLGAAKESDGWLVPFVYEDGSQSQGMLRWLNGNQLAKFKDPQIGSWILLNKDSKGMFRVNYGRSQEDLLTESVYQTLTPSERAALVDDAFMLAWEGVEGSNLGNALALFDKLADETDYVPFSLAMAHVRTLKHLYSQKGLAANFELKIAEILENTYSKLYWYKSGDVSVGKSMWVRAVVEAACDNYASTCQIDAANNANIRSQILSDLIATVNCYEIRESKQSTWKQHFKNLYNKGDSQYERADALYALACPQALEAKGSSAIHQYLETISSDSILEQDALMAYSYIYSRTEHINQTMTYIYESFSDLMTRFGDDFLATLITDISKLLLPPYYKDLLDQMKWKSAKGSKTYQAIINSQNQMESMNNFVMDNFYQVSNWILSNTTTYKPLPPPVTHKPTSLPPSSSSSSSTSLSLLATCILSFVLRLSRTRPL